MVLARDEDAAQFGREPRGGPQAEETTANKVQGGGVMVT